MDQQLPKPENRFQFLPTFMFLEMIRNVEICNKNSGSCCFPGCGGKPSVSEGKAGYVLYMEVRGRRTGSLCWGTTLHEDHDLSISGCVLLKVLMGVKPLVP